MTREKAIKEYVIPSLKHTWNEKINKEVLEALEQEPILDKIRAEIEPTRKMYLEMNDIDWLNGCDYVLSVIDKYKAKSEPQESEG